MKKNTAIHDSLHPSLQCFFHLHCAASSSPAEKETTPAVLPSLQKIMQEFERQNEKMKMVSEVMGDAIDDALEGDEEEDETEELVMCDSSNMSDSSTCSTASSSPTETTPSVPPLAVSCFNGEVERVQISMGEVGKRKR